MKSFEHVRGALPAWHALGMFKPVLNWIEVGVPTCLFKAVRLPRSISAILFSTILPSMLLGLTLDHSIY